jgi:omega-amidase
MNDQLSIGIIQTDLLWQNVEGNLSMLSEKVSQFEANTDLIILPEMFSTGYTLEVHGLAEPMNDKTMQWLAKQASDTQATITGSYIVKEGAHYYNRLVWMQADGQFDIYDKRHLFRMAGEDKVYQSGSSRLIKEVKGWKVCPMICYDLRFPTWSRNRMLDGELEYDLLLYVANWPAARMEAWDSLLKARAVENLSYSVGVNRTGTDGKGLSYTGHSAIVSPLGQTLWYSEKEEEVRWILDKKFLLELRRSFPSYLDADNFTLEL